MEEFLRGVVVKRLDSLRRRSEVDTQKEEDLFTLVGYVAPALEGSLGPSAIGDVDFPQPQDRPPLRALMGLLSKGESLRSISKKIVKIAASPDLEGG